MPDNWTTKAVNRMEWRRVIGAVKAGNTLHHQYDDDDDDDDDDDEDGKSYSN